MTVLTDTQVVTASGGLVELGYSQVAANVTITSNTAGSGTEVIAPLTVVCDGSPVLVEFWCGQTVLGPSGQVSVSLYKDGAEIHRQWTVPYNPGAGADYPPVCASYRTTPTAGLHTFGVKAYGPSSPSLLGTGTNNAPIFLRVSKIVQATQWPAATTGTIICTSSTRPASPFAGQQIYETNTSKSLTYNGTAWVSPQAQTVPPSVSVGFGTTSTYTQDTNIVWTTADYNTDTMWTSGATVTVKTAGIYLVTFMGRATSTLSANLNAYIIAGSAGAYDTQVSYPATTDARWSMSTVRSLAVSDTIFGRIQWSGGGTITLQGATSMRPTLTATFLGKSA